MCHKKADASNQTCYSVTVVLLLPTSCSYLCRCPKDKLCIPTTQARKICYRLSNTYIQRKDANGVRTCREAFLRYPTTHYTLSRLLQRKQCTETINNLIYIKLGKESLESTQPRSEKIAFFWIVAQQERKCVVFMERSPPGKIV